VNLQSTSQKRQLSNSSDVWQHGTSTQYLLLTAGHTTYPHSNIKHEQLDLLLATRRVDVALLATSSVWYWSIRWNIKQGKTELLSTFFKFWNIRFLSAYVIESPRYDLLFGQVSKIYWKYLGVQKRIVLSLYLYYSIKMYTNKLNKKLFRNAKNRELLYAEAQEKAILEQV